MNRSNYIWDTNNLKTYKNVMGIYKTEITYKFITKYLMNNTKILDIGGGSGRFAIPLEMNKHDVTIIDPDSGAMKILRNKNSTI